MRAYRESFPREDGRRGLTQEELFRRMGEVNVEYAERFSHATVSRWESGGTRPHRGPSEGLWKSPESFALGHGGSDGDGGGRP